MNEHIFLCVVAIDEPIARLDVEPFDCASDVLCDDGLHLVGLDRSPGGVVVAASDVLVGHFDSKEMVLDGRPVGKFETEWDRPSEKPISIEDSLPEAQRGHKSFILLRPKFDTKKALGRLL